MSSSGRVRHIFEGFQPYGHRLTYAFALSLLFHALLLSLTFGGAGSWLAGLGFPWHERRFDGVNLQVALVPAQTLAPEPAELSPMPTEQSVSNRPVPAPSPS